MVIRPDGTPQYTSMEPRPVYDENIYRNYTEPVHYCEDGTKIRWTEDGNVYRWAPDGTVTVWFKRVTIRDVVLRPENGNFTKFNADGSVLDILDSQTWFWGIKNVECKPYRIDKDDYNPAEDCGCGYSERCCGYDRYQDF